MQGIPGGQNSQYDSTTKKPTVGTPQPPGRRLRGSCDFCTKRKRKCDGDGISRCSFCVAKNQAECHYSVRLPTGPRRDAKSGTKPSNPNSGANCPSKRVSSAPCGDGNRQEGATVTATVAAALATAAAAAAAASTTAARCEQAGLGLQGRGAPMPTAAGPVGGRRFDDGQRVSTMTLKRPRISASPATGLVGYQENVYIGDFFQTMGFMPFTNESMIRKAMVSTMFGTGGQAPSFGGFQGEENALVSMRGGGGEAAKGAAAACMLWSTVTLGYLVRGRPRESVAGYVHLARQALAGCFDDDSVETARAFTAMALVYNFVGDEAKYSKHIDFARRIVDALPPELIPPDVVDTLLFTKSCGLFTTESASSFTPEVVFEALESSCDWESPAMMKEPRIFRKAELCRWLLKTDVQLGACFHHDMLDSCSHSTEGEECPARESPNEGESKEVGLTRFSAEDVKGYVEMASFMVNAGDEMQEPPQPGMMSKKFAADAVVDFKLLEHAAESPEVRDGVGELYFRSNMAYVLTLQGNTEDGLQNLMRCADVILLSPGLCRFTSWGHLAHCIFSAMALTCSHLQYERLRTAYNSVIDEGSGMQKAPPIEEWDGMRGLCKSLFCRSIYQFFTGMGKEGEVAPPSCDILYNAERGLADGSSTPGIVSTDLAPAPDPVAVPFPGSEELPSHGGFYTRTNIPHAEEAGGTYRVSPVERIPDRSSVVTAAEAVPPSGGFLPAFSGVSHSPGQEALMVGSAVETVERWPEASRGCDSYSTSSTTATLSVDSATAVNSLDSTGPHESLKAVSGGDVTSSRVGELPATANDSRSKALARTQDVDDGTGLMPLPLHGGYLDEGSGRRRELELGLSDMDAADNASLLDAVDALLADPLLDGSLEDDGSGMSLFHPENS